MADRQVVAVCGEDGKQWWFRVADAKRWPSVTPEGGELFRVAGRWVVLNLVAQVKGEPGRFIDDDAAVDWLTANGLEPPENLRDCAERRRLR